MDQVPWFLGVCGMTSSGRCRESNLGSSWDKNSWTLDTVYVLVNVFYLVTIRSHHSTRLQTQKFWATRRRSDSKGENLPWNKGCLRELLWYKFIDTSSGPKYLRNPSKPGLPTFQFILNFRTLMQAVASHPKPSLHLGVTFHRTSVTILTR